MKSAAFRCLRAVLGLATLTGFAWVAGCGQPNEFVAPPPPAVTVQQPAQRNVTVYSEQAGRTEAVKMIEIRARVRGFLRSIDFKDGQVVEKGQKLFQIEPESYAAAVKSAEASLAKAGAALKLAEVSYQRIRQAFETKAVSEIDLLTAEADKDAAEAGVLSAEADLAKATLDQDYTQITAPATGVASRHLVDIGNLVGGADSTLLTTITIMNPIHVYFNVPERDILPFLLEGGPAPDKRRTLKLELELADGSRYDQVGTIDYGDPQVNPQTGTLTMRAQFQNDQFKLLPGLFVKALIPSVREQALLVPDLAVQRDMAGTYLLVVDDQSVVQSRYVETGPRVGDERIIESGLEPGEQVIVKGLQRARPDLKVRVEQAEPAPPPEKPSTPPAEG